MDLVQHGLIQKAKRDAEALKYTIRNDRDAFRLWVMEPTGWSYIGQFTRKDDVVEFLTARCPVE